MDAQKSTSWWHGILRALPFFSFLGITMLITGILFLSIQVSTSTVGEDCVNKTFYDYEVIQEIDYKNCTDIDDDRILCSESADKSLPCVCRVDFVVNKAIDGDVVIFYQLNTFNESSIATKPNFWQSRDNNQLKGNLGNTPASACHPYDYDDENKTIVPCGAIADAMFTDTLLSLVKDQEKVPSLSYGILHDEDKEGYQNPADNLTVAFQNYSKPKNWTKHIWELTGQDINSTENKGLQNEAFIAWMHTEWARKPTWKLNRTADSEYKQGLTPGNYTAYIKYTYPPSRYNGPRTLSLAREFLREHPKCNLQYIITQKALNHSLGLAGVIIGTILLTSAALLVIAFKVTELQKKRRCRSASGSNPPKIVITPTSESSENGLPPPSAKTEDEQTLLNKSKTSKVNGQSFGDQPTPSAKTKDDQALLNKSKTDEIDNQSSENSVPRPSAKMKDEQTLLNKSKTSKTNEVNDQSSENIEPPPSAKMKDEQTPLNKSRISKTDDVDDQSIEKGISPPKTKDEQTLLNKSKTSKVNGQSSGDQATPSAKTKDDQALLNKSKTDEIDDQSSENNVPPPSAKIKDEQTLLNKSRISKTDDVYDRSSEKGISPPKTKDEQTLLINKSKTDEEDDQKFL